jgi:NADH dehydrogenase (ubiquinone) 1 alpha subcomplex subunit 9
MDFNNKEMIDWTIKNSNVVINLVGPRPELKNRKDFEFINVEVAKRIAQACAKNEGVVRLIHFSAAGANPKA